MREICIQLTKPFMTKSKGGHTRHRILTLALPFVMLDATFEEEWPKFTF